MSEQNNLLKFPGVVLPGMIARDAAGIFEFDCADCDASIRALVLAPGEPKSGLIIYCPYCGNTVKDGTTRETQPSPADLAWVNAQIRTILRNT